MSLASVRNRLQKIAELLDAPRPYAGFRTQPLHDGSAHCEFDGEYYHYILSERGETYGQKRTDDAEKLLFWLVADMTVKMAIDYELANREPDIDGRRIWFPYHVELLRRVNEDWASKQDAKYAETLAANPYNDG